MEASLSVCSYWDSIVAWPHWWRTAGVTPQHRWNVQTTHQNLRNVIQFTLIKPINYDKTIYKIAYITTKALLIQPWLFTPHDVPHISLTHYVMRVSFRVLPFNWAYWKGREATNRAINFSFLSTLFVLVFMYLGVQWLSCSFLHESNILFRSIVSLIIIGYNGQPLPVPKHYTVCSTALVLPFSKFTQLPTIT